MSQLIYALLLCSPLGVRGDPDQCWLQIDAEYQRPYETLAKCEERREEVEYMWRVDHHTDWAARCVSRRAGVWE